MARQSVWERLAIDSLRNIQIKRKSLDNVEERLDKIRDELSGLKGTAASLAPAVGGILNKEEARRIDCVTLERELSKSLQELKNDIESFDNAWIGLDENEQIVLTRFFIFRTKDYIDRLIDELNYEKSKIYEIKDEALYKFTMYLYGDY